MDPRLISEGYLEDATSVIAFHTKMSHPAISFTATRWHPDSNLEHRAGTNLKVCEVDEQ